MEFPSYILCDNTETRKQINIYILNNKTEIKELELTHFNRRIKWAPNGNIDFQTGKDRSTANPGTSWKY
jgi:hypothetical protein